MTREEDDRVRGKRHTLTVCPTADDRWPSGRSGEPRLDELFDDTIMRLLWRADGLEPVKARATLLGPQDLVRRTSARGPSRVAWRHRGAAAWPPERRRPADPRRRAICACRASAPESCP